jgi:hypothetical protein
MVAPLAPGVEGGGNGESMKTTALLAVSGVFLLVGCAGSGESGPQQPTPTAGVSTATPTAGGDVTPSASATPTVTVPSAATPSASGLATPTATPPADATETPSAAETSTPTETATPAGTPTDTPTPTITRTPTSTPTSTPTLGPGANITFFGLLRADGMLVDPIGFDDQDRPVYPRPFGSSFVVVLESRAGTSNARVAPLTFDHDPEDPARRPDLQIQSDRALGDGSPEVCDHLAPRFGGVPAVDPPSFDETREISDALNDLGCLFVDGAGAAQGRTRIEACVFGSDGQYDFVNTTTQIQFCATIPLPVRFPFGDVVLTARVRDVTGAPGPARQIVVRVAVPPAAAAP